MLVVRSFRSALILSMVMPQRHSSRNSLTRQRRASIKQCGDAHSIKSRLARRGQAGAHLHANLTQKSVLPPRHFRFLSSISASVCTSLRLACRNLNGNLCRKAAARNKAKAFPHFWAPIRHTDAPSRLHLRCGSALCACISAAWTRCGPLEVKTMVEESGATITLRRTKRRERL